MKFAVSRKGNTRELRGGRPGDRAASSLNAGRLLSPARHVTPQLSFARIAVSCNIGSMIVSINGLQYVTVPEAAKLIGITPGRLCQMLRAGDAKGYKAGPRAWLMPKSEVRRLKNKPQTTGRPRVGKRLEKSA